MPHIPLANFKFEVIDEVPQGQRHICVTHGVRGYFAVEVWWNPGDIQTPLEFTGGFWEPWASHPDSFETREEAQACAVAWAESEGLPCLSLKNQTV